ncbi:alcohol dehydrogenase [Shewanella mangrovi]|uniref:Alcohol dehydrogenase n=1 Tax=Shewanella mangrovi TaxID=1515746 RepID=A0A094LNE2_9GAMM|nr:aldo/keto reductase [Shewanella mangrovi]KFZ36648.1 alcohol dehydrogenase [Shewanella mangrovi]
MDKQQLGQTGLEIVPLVFGGNVFGWTIDQKTSFAILDAFVDAGFDSIDTADCYSIWAPDNQGGESETIIGNWLKARPGIRDKVKIFTKVGADLEQPGKKGLSANWIKQAIDASLARLNTDYVDLYFAHWPDADTDIGETLQAFNDVKQSGKINAIGASNLNADQLQASLDAAKQRQLTPYQVLQPEYNLYDRSGFEGTLQELCVKENIGVVTYYSLASGFLSGKYRTAADLGQSARGEGIGKYLDIKGHAILAALDNVAEAHSAQPAEVALAWLMAARGVTAPIVSATKPQHIDSFAKAAMLKLSNEDLALLTQAGI